MAVSGNGWPVSPVQSDLGIETFTINGASFPVRGGKVRQLLEYVAIQVNNRVERANATYGCWGYSYRENVNSPGTWSNHASGTAIDYNATRHPNGVPTASTFTAAQIAEIHKILAEVDNAVRWGGDYNGTPDAMHFEINATPEQLDVIVIDPEAMPTSAATPAGYGAPTLFDITKLPVLTENSVSLPTLMNYGHGYAQWLYRPSQSGLISIDGLLSHYSDPAVEASTPGGPSINLYIFPVRLGSDGGLIPDYTQEVQAAPWPGDDQHPARNTGQMSVEVEAGKSYVIRATTTPEWPWIKAVVRIGDFAKVSDWIEAPEVEGVMNLRGRTYEITPNIYSLHFPSVLDSRTGDDWFYGTGDPGWMYQGLELGPKFAGQYSVGTSTFGRAPWAVSAGNEAMRCAWRWARRFRGDQKWSMSEDVAWNGTKLPGDFATDYYEKHDGSATCWIHDDVDQEQIGMYSLSSPLGVRYRATPPGVSWNGEAHSAALWGQFTHGNVIWEAYAGSLIVDFDLIRWSAGPSGWGGPWSGPDWDEVGGSGYRPDYMPDELDGSPDSPTVEWESDEPAEIVAVYWAPDEYTYLAGDTRVYPQDNRLGAGSVINWYGQRVQPAEHIEGVGNVGDWVPAGPHPQTMWGPWGVDRWYGQAVGDGPAALAAGSQLLGSTSGGIGGNWSPLDESFWGIANTRLVPWDTRTMGNSEQWFRENLPAIPAQMRFIGMPRVMLSDSMPFAPPSGYGAGTDESGDPGDGFEINDYLLGQSIALKVVLQPRRYRLVYPAKIPNITYSGQSSIAMNSEGDGQVLY